MPFLYSLIYSKLENGKKTTVLDNTDDSHSDHSDDSDVDVDFNLAKSPTVECGQNQIEKARVEKRMKQSKVVSDFCGSVLNHDSTSNERLHQIAKTIVSMVAFGHNCRCNTLQVWNSVVFLACGVTERMHSYFHHSMSCKNAHKLLASIGKQAQESLALAMSIPLCKPLSPLICIDNINFQEKKHAVLPENTTHMFHGTWGYINGINKELFEGFDPEDFSVQRYK
jgi:hypothetical protein